MAHVVGQLAIGGMEKLLAEFARHTARTRTELQFICIGRSGPVADEIAACGWEVIHLDKPDGLRPRVILDLARAFRRWRADVVHTHNNPGLFYGAPAARLAGVPGVIHTRHGRNYGAGPRQVAAFRLASRLTDYVVCVSDDTHRLSKEEGVPSGRLERVWNGIDLARFNYLGPAPGGPAVLVARLSPEKNAACLLQAAALISRDRPSFRLEIAGDGPCMADLKRLAGEWGVSDCVRFLGEVKDVPGVLARASVFVLPSLSEGVSLTLLEAMARGLPVVATAVGGTPEVVVEGETGLLVPAESAVALATALTRLLDDPELGRRMGLAGRRRVETEFSVHGMLEQYDRLYRTAARQNNHLAGREAGVRA